MKNRYIPAFVMLTAGLIASLYCIVQQRDVTYSLVLLLFVLLIFYAIGTIAARIIGTQQAENERQRKEQEQKLLEEQERLAAEEAEKQEEDSENKENGDSEEDFEAM